MKNIRSVERALDVLRSFAETPLQSASNIQKALGLSRPTVYRLLNTLESKGFIRSFGEPRQFRLSEISLQLGNAWLSSVDVSRVSGPYLQRLWKASGETVALIVPHGDRERILIQELRSTKPLSLSLGVGYIAPLHRGTSGKVILAFLPEAKAEQVLRSLPNKREREEIKATLVQIRKERCWATTGEVMVGGASIASPVFQRSGAVVGAVTVFGPDARLKGAVQAHVKKIVRGVAEEVSAALGFQEASESARKPQLR